MKRPPRTRRLTRPVRHFVRGRDGKELVVTLDTDGVWIREKGRRTEYGPLPYGWLHQRGGELKAEETRRRRARIPDRVSSFRVRRIG